jgi:opacity protein-like surface antigen
MKKYVMLFTFLFALSLPVYAQSDYPKFEVFGGYSYFSADVNFDDPFDNDGNDFFSQREGFHGGAFSLAGNLTRHFGVVADFSYHKREIELPGSDIDLSTFAFLFGPRVTARGHRVEGFAHALVGGVRRKVEDIATDTDLALGLGGGLDIKATNHFAVRLVQLDYLPFRDRNFFTGDKEWRHNLRVSAGATFRW